MRKFETKTVKETFRQLAAICLLIVIPLYGQTAAQDRIDGEVLARIKTEGFQNSQVMANTAYLTDVFGNRLTNSRNLEKAKEWAWEMLGAYGFENVQTETWGTWGEGWHLERFSVEMTAPTYERLIAHPLAWSASTDGTVSGSPILVSVRSNADFAKYKGKLKGAIVINGNVPFNTPESRGTNRFRRFSDEDLARMAAVTDPTKDPSGGGTTNFQDEDRDWRASLERGREITKFFKDEGVAALLQPSSRPNGVLSVQGSYFPDPNLNPPTFVVAREQFARMQRLIERAVPVRIEVSLRAGRDPDGTGSNVLAEISGSDPKLKDEVVLLGGHFDSWHAGTGAADNGASCMVMVEALRILKAIGVKPRRTIRVALWDGEEQDYLGSVGYVKKYYGDPMTIELKPDHEKLSAYYNLDNGAGRIRGIYLQGNEAARPIFRQFFEPFGYLGASTITTLNTGGTDHMAFDAVGLPGFQFIQDPLDYGTRVHHSNLDMLEAVIEEDLKVNAVIIAAIAYQTAMRDERMPRKALPTPAIVK